MTTWTAAQISTYDQALAGADRELDRLLLTLQIGISEAGEHQAMANISLLAGRREPAELTGLLMAALRRLNDGGTA